MSTWLLSGLIILIATIPGISDFHDILATFELSDKASFYFAGLGLGCDVYWSGLAPCEVWTARPSRLHPGRGILPEILRAVCAPPSPAFVPQLSPTREYHASLPSWALAEGA